MLRKCYISSARGVNTRRIIDLLSEKGIIAKDFYSVKSDSNIWSSIDEDIKKSDFLLAILSSESDSNVIYEIGLARGAKKPVLILFTGLGPIPYFLKGLFYTKLDINNIDILKYAIKNFLNNQENIMNKKYPITKNTKKKSRNFPKNDIELFELYKKLDIIRSNINENIFNDFIIDLFNKEKISFESTHGPYEIADMSIWIDSLESTLGNPILLELKVGSLSENSLNDAEENLEKSLIISNIQSGIIIYLDSEKRQFKHSKLRLPLILRFEIYELIRSLSKESLESILLKERNKIAHGGIIE